MDDHVCITHIVCQGQAVAALPHHHHLAPLNVPPRHLSAQQHHVSPLNTRLQDASNKASSLTAPQALQKRKALYDVLFC